MRQTVRYLVAGADGMLGREVGELLQRRRRDVVESSLFPREHQLLLDITDPQAVDALVARVRPSAVFNCAAFTDVDGAEAREDAALAVNATGAGNLARACHRYASLLVHVSTDYVFDGQAREPYRPESPTAPRTAYGRSKLAGERAIQRVGGRWLIVRTSWLFGRYGKNFVDTILNLATQKPRLRVVKDQVGCPTYAPDLARCLVDLAEKHVTELCHFCNPPPCSWFDLATRAVELAGLKCRVEPCATAEFSRPAPRPAYSVLDCTTTFALLGWAGQSWEDALRDHLLSRRLQRQASG